LIDDVLDYEGTQSGKPLLADLKSGLSTAPLLLAQEEFPVLKDLAARQFSKDGDIDLVCSLLILWDLGSSENPDCESIMFASQASELVDKSTGIERSKALAIEQAELACQAAMQYAPSPARDALLRLAQLVVFRSK
jgi:geranylgeranyl pyrophosphate synthase